MSSLFRDRALPLAVFPALCAIAYKLIFVPVFGVGIDLGQSCQPTPTILGIAGLDEALCPFVDFFSKLMHDPVGQAFLTYGLGIGLPLVLIPAVEAYRPGQSRLLKYPMAWILTSQVITVGFTMPLYWLTFILKGGPKKIRHGTTSSYRQADVLALTFGIFIGLIVPSVAMMLMDDPGVTAMWQIYPVYVSIAQFLHLQFQPHSQHSHSAFTTLQVIFFGAFLITSSVHISTVWPLVNNWEGLKATLIPSFSLGSDATAAQLFLNFLKWDITIAYASTILASFWSADNTQQVVSMAVWYALSVPTVGFGASVMGVALWRNGLL